MISIYHGAAQDVLRTRDLGVFDAVITDPPYASGGFSLADKQRATKDKYTNFKGAAQHACPDFDGDRMDQRCWVYHMAYLFGLCRSVTKPGGIVAAFVDWRQLPALTDVLQISGWTWRGVPPLPGVYRHTNVQGKERLHQTQKPLQLMLDLLRIVPPGSRVLDPFCGSGSTLAAAEKLGHDAVGIESSLPIALAAAERLNTDLIRVEP